MAKPRPPLPAKLMCALFSTSLELMERAQKEMEKHFGTIDLEGPLYNFTETDHYWDAMGEDLKKRLISFENLVEQDQLKNIKNLTNRLEEELSQTEEGKVLPYSRPINLDPGLVTGAKLILATMKDFSHRIYLGNHVYAEVTLIYVKGQFRPQPWTYPDYKREGNLAFLSRVRGRYMQQMGL